MLILCYFHGALRVLSDEATGSILAVQCRTSGADASVAGFSPDYILAAKTAAILAYESQYSEA